GCGWVHLEQLMKRIPILLSGNETQEVGGLGQIPEPEMRRHFSESAGFISMGTKPAPMTLGQIESECAGCPGVFWDNEYGIRNEEFAAVVSTNTDDLIAECERLLDDESYRYKRHLSTMGNRERFSNETIVPQWQKLLEEVMS